MFLSVTRTINPECRLERRAPRRSARSLSACPIPSGSTPTVLLRASLTRLTCSPSLRRPRRAALFQGPVSRVASTHPCRSTGESRGRCWTGSKQVRLWFPVSLFGFTHPKYIQYVASRRAELEARSLLMVRLRSSGSRFEAWGKYVCMDVSTFFCVF